MSAHTGRSPFRPQVIYIGIDDELGKTYQIPFDGRQTPTSAFPSPSKSPTRGLSPLTPNCKARNPSVLCWIYQVPVLGRQTAKSVLPSASKSAGTGISPDKPN